MPDLIYWQQRARRIEEVLRLLEWIGDAYEDACEECPKDGRAPVCPACSSHQHRGHIGDCKPVEPECKYEQRESDAAEAKYEAMREYDRD